MLGSLSFLNDVFWATVGIVFISAIITALLKIKRKDKCLKQFDKYRVVTNLNTGFTMWGEMKVYSSGIEFFFDEPYDNGNGLVKKSFIFYENEIPEISSISRYSRGLSDKKNKKRVKKIKRLIKYKKYIRAWRYFWNIFKILKEAVRQTVSLLVRTSTFKHVKKTKIPRVNSHIDKTTKQVSDYVDSYHEPILEHYIGEKVVVELERKGGYIIEFEGYLYEYSKDFICIVTLNQEINNKEIIYFRKISQKNKNRKDIQIEKKNDFIFITNTSEDILILNKFLGDVINNKIDLLAFKDKVVKLIPPKDATRIEIGRLKSVDMIISRKSATVRHAIKSD